MYIPFLIIYVLEYPGMSTRNSILEPPGLPEVNVYDLLVHQGAHTNSQNFDIHQIHRQLAMS